MAALTEEDRLYKVIDKLSFSVDEVLIPGTVWKFVDFYELPSGQYKMVVDLGCGRYIDIRVDPALKLRASKMVVKRTIESKQENESEASEPSPSRKSVTQFVPAKSQPAKPKAKPRRSSHLSIVS